MTKEQTYKKACNSLMDAYCCLIALGIEEEEWEKRIETLKAKEHIGEVIKEVFRLDYNYPDHDWKWKGDEDESE
jgi:hypothetical protein